MRRPAWLCRIGLADLQSFTGCQIDDPNSTGIAEYRIVNDALLGKCDFLPVWRPCGVIAEVSDSSYRFSCCTHYKDTSPTAIRPKCDEVPIWREGRLSVVRKRIFGQIDGVFSADTLKINVP